MKNKDKSLDSVKEQITDGLCPLEKELLNFIELVQSSRGFFNLNFLRVVKKNKKAYFDYMGIVKEFPLEYITDEQKKQDKK